MKTWDVIIVGGGIIGLSLAIALRKRGAQVLIVERGEPGREASHAAAGMLADCGMEIPSALQNLAAASARMYPEFVHELQDESGIKVDLRDQGTILFLSSKGTTDHSDFPTTQLFPRHLTELEPALSHADRRAIYLQERSVDPRALTLAAFKAAKHREVGVASGTEVSGILISEGRATGVSAERATYSAPIVVNCAGAWSGQLPPHHFPTRPVKGQMLSVIGAPILKHVIRAPEIYLVPRSDGRILIGSTVEEAGYDKRTEVATIQRMHRTAIDLVPALGTVRIHEALGRFAARNTR